MNIAEMLSDQVEQHPDWTALIDSNRGRKRSFSFDELQQNAGEVAMLLQQSGLRPGDTVLVFHPMSVELYVVLTALFRLGLVAMFLDPAVGRAHIQQSCELRPPKGLIASSKSHLLRFVSPAVRRIPIKFSIGPKVPGAIRLERASSLPYLETIQTCSADTPALVTFTSGSGGRPKAAMRTHGFLLAQHRAVAQSLELRAGEIELTTQPIFVLANLASGVASLIPDVDLRRPDSIDPGRVVAQMNAHQPTRAGASPALFEQLVEYSLANKIIFPKLEKVYTGGGPIYPYLLDGLQNIAPNARITAIYGASEAEPIACLTRSEITDNDRHAMLNGNGLLAGRPVPMIHLRIMGNRWGEPVGPFSLSEFDHACLDAGVPGEIVVCGKHVLRGYICKQDDMENKFEVEGQRWHRTGDAGFIDTDGRLWLLGRCEGCIDDASGTLFPFAVERVACQFQIVRRAAVVSVHGKRVLAVEPRRGLLRRSDLAAMLETFSEAKVEHVHVLKRMPVDLRHNAKIDYPALQSLLEKQA